MDKQSLKDRAASLRAELEQVENQIDRFDSRAKANHKSFLRKNGFKLIHWDTPHYFKQIDPRYAFWFSIEDYPAWGVSDNEENTNFFESESFNTFEECWEDFERQQDFFRVKQIEAKATINVMMDIRNPFENQDYWREKLYERLNVIVNMESQQ